MMDKRGLQNFVYYLMFHGARYLFPLVITPFLARVLGPPQFADFILWNSCVWTASLLMEFGFYIYAVNRVAVAEMDGLAGTVGSIVTAKMILAPLAVIGYAAAVYGLDLSERQPLACAIGLVAMLSYGASFAWFFQGLQRGGLAVSVEAAPLLLQFVLVIAFIRHPSDLWLVALFQTTAAVLTLIVSLFLLKRSRVGLKVDVKGGLRAIREASPYFVERCCYTLYSTATPIIIAGLSSASQVAFYAIGDKINAFLTGIFGPLFQAAIPIVAKRLAAEPANYTLSIRLVAFITGLTAILAGVAYVESGPFILWFFSDAYAGAIPVAHWFCMTSILMAMQLGMTNFIVIPGGRAKVMMVTSVTALAISLCVQAALVPSQGAIGSAIARLLSEVAVASILAYVAVRIAMKKPVRSNAMDET